MSKSSGGWSYADITFYYAMMLTQPERYWDNVAESSPEDNQRSIKTGRDKTTSWQTETGVHVICHVPVTAHNFQSVIWLRYSFTLYSSAFCSHRFEYEIQALIWLPYTFEDCGTPHIAGYGYYYMSAIINISSTTHRIYHLILGTLIQPTCMFGIERLIWARVYRCISFGVFNPVHGLIGAGPNGKLFQTVHLVPAAIRNQAHLQQSTMNITPSSSAHVLLASHALWGDYYFVLSVAEL